MLLKPIKNEQAYLKAGGFGFEGSGKTTSLALIAIGLHRYIKSTRPIAFYDTETGSSYVKPLFDFAKIKLIGVRSRSLVDLAAFIKEAEANCDICIVDSLTHPYRELCSTYVKNKKDGTKFIRMQDWQVIKDQWNAAFSEPFVNTKIHMLWASRAKNIFDDIEDVEASAQAGREIFKSVQVGTGARAETESAYEPGILIEFSREMQELDRKGNPSLKARKSGVYRRRVTVVKDRFMYLDGQSATFETPFTAKGKIDFKLMIEVNPTFQFFLPHIQSLALGGDHEGFSGTTSDKLFEDDGKASEAANRRVMRKTLLDEIGDQLKYFWPNSTGTDRTSKLKVLKTVFGTTSWTAIENMSDQELAAGHRKIFIQETDSDDDKKAQKAALYKIAETPELPAIPGL